MQIAELRSYARRRTFPTFIGKDGARHVRHVEINAREPVFVDHRGVHCAVAHLMSESGWSRAVRSIASSNNNVYVDEVENGPLIRWIETSGLTQQEAALIQPSYNFKPRPRPVPVKPPPQDHYSEEAARLVEHFHEVDKQLREETEISIDEALYRLRQRLKG